ncbi:phosphopantothenoylcysteine decarboxylase [Streptococcus ovuberis]|uniref:Phosphopantothenoylcysteine decarboxylase n=1 Tax=Streptococcus ovuberis TaxID=1936207 RepID=A0A7X6MZA9_9STRE|nr:phosphopantothenoylcysteine decarboxylase [Streptococcus ovuberis]NKZ20543.1 phosphopantothenoylcysteine decarboxylase [Streptococcus ovuberis]
MTKRITLAVTGSISAYKAADLTSQLTKLGFAVTVLMTASATRFITPLTLQVLSKNLVHLDIMEEPQPDKVNHIELAKQTDLFIVAPASANTIAKLANGLADDIVSCTALALSLDTPKLVAPAMNTQMYINPITQNNLEKLKKYGYREILPREALLACGDYGPGALAELSVITNTIMEIFNEY